MTILENTKTPLNVSTDTHVNTLYQPVTKEIFARCQQIKLVAFDVDGVFSDGSIYLGNAGEEYKAFNTKDGYGVKALIKCGVTVAIITGRKSAIVEQRMRSLNVQHILQGREDKHKALIELMRVTGYRQDKIMSVGDDMPDLQMFANSSVKVATKDAHPLVRQQADVITTLGGGKGAVREVCDLLLQARNKLDIIHGASL